jgi:hypothetical protein
MRTTWCAFWGRRNQSPGNLGNPDEFSIRALAETEIELTGSHR